ncbi:MAG: hypothetical protein FWG70_10370 [Oscillospiraceae bacterium]|nr:hypothetical protein [Oscillospiraceae bacterium]
MEFAQILGFLIGMALVGLIPGFIAKAKGRSFWGFFFLGMCGFMPGLIAVLCVKNLKKESLRNQAEFDGYKKLFEDGKITEEELRAKRKELLNW